MGVEVATKVFPTGNGLIEPREDFGQDRCHLFVQTHKPRFNNHRNLRDGHVAHGPIRFVSCIQIKAEHLGFKGTIACFMGIKNHQFDLFSRAIRGHRTSHATGAANDCSNTVHPISHQPKSDLIKQTFIIRVIYLKFDDQSNLQD